MRRPTRALAAAVLTTALVGAGLAGSLSSGRDYSLHRGFATLVQFRRAGTGRLEDVRFYSRALHRIADYLVYLPPRYDPNRRYPVYYLLHGAPGQPRVFVDIANMDVRLDDQLSLGHVRPMILVYPDGRIGGSTFSDSEWANTPSGDFESYVIEVVHNVDRRFATIPRRQDRVIGGFSAGAYGAMNIALHHLGDFANVQSWSGYFTQTRTGVFASATRTALANNSPLDFVVGLRRRLASDPLRVYMFVGRDDASSAQQLPMARALLAAGAAVQYRFYPGGHDWSVWYPRLNQMLELASRDVSRQPSRQVPTRAPAAAPPKARLTAVGHSWHRSELWLIGSLLLALVSAALINLGFVLQHRAHDRARTRRGGALTGGFREPAWLLGQATGGLGFAGQIAAIVLAPLTLVQAFSAGSLALSVPLAARLFGHRITRTQLVAIVVIAVSLASLPLGFGPVHRHLRPGLLIAAALAVMLAGGLLTRRAGAATLAVAAGALYGAADGAIKAASIGLGDGVLAGWVLLAAACTLGGFLAFQSALRDGDAVGPLSLMNALCALTAIALGVAAFGEPLGSSPATVLLHIAAIVAVLACVRPLAGAQQRLAASAAARTGSAAPTVRSRPAEARRPRRRRVAPAAVARRLAAWLLGSAALIVAALTALGLLYQLRQLRWLALGPRVPDALPLLQLAGFDAQPLARLIAATLPAGLALGWALTRTDRRRRVVLVGVFALLVMLVGSDASYALARNLPFDQVLVNRAPGPGPWLEALLLTAGSAVPGPMAPIGLPVLPLRLPLRRALAGALTGVIGAPIAVAVLASGGHAGAQPSLSVPIPPSPRRTTCAPGARPARAAASAASAASAGRPSIGDVLDAALRTERARIHVPAATAAVVVCGRVVWAGAAGVLDLRSARPATDSSLFVLNSAVKTVVATMIMQEIQAGRLSLDTSLSQFYPRLPNARRISVRMLLNMTSGLPDYLDSRRIQWMIHNRPRHHWTTEQVLTGLGAGLGRPSFEPGRRYQYSDTNYIVLGAILTRITHTSIERDFQQSIARPLGLASATFVPTPAAEARTAHPYRIDPGGALRSLWVPGYGVSSAVWGPVFTDGGLASSSVDLARFANALLGDRLLSAAPLAQMTHLGRGDYGFGIRGRSFDGHLWLGHGGYFVGFEAEDWSDPSRQLTIAVATNLQIVGTEPTSDRIWRAIARAYDRQRAGAPRRSSPHPTSLG